MPPSMSYAALDARRARVNGVQVVVFSLSTKTIFKRITPPVLFLCMFYGGGDLPNSRLIFLLHGPSPRANCTDRATAACGRSECQLLRIESATWSA
jgi:hypothetical protein